MNNTFKKTNIGALVAAVIFGSAVTFTATSYFGHSTNTETEPTSSEKKPLYWVAPMDANYRRDKPGKSPMGMDLVPVYSDGGSGSDSGPGTIKISPEVVNNLGVRVATVKRLPLHTQISTVGYVKYDEDQLVHIHPRVEGWIEKLYVKASGDPVNKGQPLYELYSPELVNAQEEFLLAVERNNQRLIRAATDRLAALQLPKQAIRDLTRTKKVKQTITFYAPQSGVIDNLNVREGYFAKPGTTLMSIGKLAQVWVEAEIFERQSTEVAIGLPVTMSLDYLPGKEWRGKIDYVYPTLNEKNRTVKVRLRFENEGEVLKPNMFAQVVIHSETNENALLIPREAVIRTGSKERVVLALGGGRYKSIYVEIGRYDRDSAEILYGLSEGDKVVSSAQFLLDSESSKSSDFKRMNYDEPVSSAWVQASINNVMADHRMVNVTHEAIDDWDWPAMTMDFLVSNSVEMSLLEKGMSLHIEIKKNDEGNYEIINIHIPDTDAKSSKEKSSSVTVNGEINSVMIGHRMLNISRGAIEEWGRPAATLDFMVSEDVDMTPLKANSDIQFTFHVADGEFIITDLQVITASTQP